MTNTYFFQTLPKSRLADLIRDIDPNLTLEDEVEELILNYVDEFIDRVLKGACLIAKHRQGNGTIEVKDVQQFLSTLLAIKSNTFNCINVIFRSQL